MISCVFLKHKRSINTSFCYLPSQFNHFCFFYLSIFQSILKLFRYLPLKIEQTLHIFPKNTSTILISTTKVSEHCKISKKYISFPSTKYFKVTHIKKKRINYPNIYFLKCQKAMKLPKNTLIIQSTKYWKVTHFPKYK